VVDVDVVEVDEVVFRAVVVVVVQGLQASQNHWPQPLSGKVGHIASKHCCAVVVVVVARHFAQPLQNH
jgi:hypothetical protein